MAKSAKASITSIWMPASSPSPDSADAAQNPAATERAASPSAVTPSPFSVPMAVRLRGRHRPGRGRPAASTLLAEHIERDQCEAGADLRAPEGLLQRLGRLVLPGRHSAIRRQQERRGERHQRAGHDQRRRLPAPSGRSARENTAADRRAEIGTPPTCAALAQPRSRSAKLSTAWPSQAMSIVAEEKEATSSRPSADPARWGR